MQCNAIPGNFGSEGTCSSEDAISIWTEMPACQPRDTIIEVPQMLDAALFQVPRLISVTGSPTTRSAERPLRSR